MKEATGELSMTAIVVVIIGIIAVAAPPVVKSVINSAGNSAKCMSAYNCKKNESGNNYTCSYVDDTGTPKIDGIQCSAKDLGYEEDE